MNDNQTEFGCLIEFSHETTLANGALPMMCGGCARCYTPTRCTTSRAANDGTNKSELNISD